MKIDELISDLQQLKDQISLAEDNIKRLKERRTAVEHDIMDLLDDQGVTRAGNDMATVSISETEVPNVDSSHWDDVWNFLFENGYTEVLRRQINSKAWANLRAIGVEIPHVTVATLRKLSVTKPR